MTEHFQHLIPAYNEQVFVPIVIWWLLAAAVQALPKPGPMQALWYVWLYNFGHILAANTDKLARRRR